VKQALRSVLVTPNVLGADGISSLSRQIVRALPGPVQVVSLHDRHCDVQGIPVAGAGGRRAALLAESARTSVRCGPDAVVVCTHLHLAPAARLLACRASRLLFVLCGIESWVPIRPTERWALLAGELMAISQHTVSRFKAANPQFLATPVVVCHPGLPARAGSVSTRGPLGSTALIAARMSAAERYKGHDLLIDAWPRVLDAHPSARLCIVGDGDDRGRLEARVAALGLSAAVSFTGAIDDEALDGQYDTCRFFVMPSRDEGFGLAFLEAMRAGKACIGGAGAAEEVIQHGVTGLIVDPANQEALVAALLRLYAEPETCRAFGAAGAIRFVSMFTDTAFQVRFQSLLRREP
jgi:phosphatidyl-myo-inositol dimannoside synthase